MTSEPERQRRKLNAATDLSNLTAVVMALNGNNPLLRDAEDRAALVRFVESLQTGKPLAGDDAARFWLPNLERVWKWMLAPIGRNGAYWAISPTGDNCHDMAAMFAGMLLTNPLRGKLSDKPCQRPQCKKWFIKRRPNQKCCTRRCGAIVKTAERISHRRKDEKKERLKIGRSAHLQWRKSRSSLDWKTWVSKKTGLSTKFLTRNFTNEGRVKSRD
jgi:hypothetical protein